ncbi:MAG: Mur ligase family protein [Sphaerochaetaceae bacterium]
MKVLIFGFGAHGGGFSATKYFLNRGNEVRITDMRSREQLGESLTYFENLGVSTTCGEHQESDFIWADLVIKNPAIKADDMLLTLAKKCATDFSILFASPLVSKIKLITITGTKGKTTTAAMVNHILNKTGHLSMQCGNMGISAFLILEELENRKKNKKPLPEYLICEMSSWQVADVYRMQSKLPEIEIATITNLMEDHLNYYNNINDYLNDKLLMLKFKCKNIVSSNELRPVISKYLKINRSKIISIENTTRKLNDVNPIYYPAYTVCQTLKIRKDVILKNIKSFSGIPHRNEFVRLIGNTIFVNDSAATIPMAVNFSIFNNFQNLPYYLICGGTDKNLHPEPMINALKKSQGIYLLEGSFTREKLIPLLEELKIKYYGPYIEIEEAVESCWKLAKMHNEDTRNQTVFLSPGASSFEYFTNEYDRGNRYKKAVNTIYENEKKQIEEIQV